MQGKINTTIYFNYGSMNSGKSLELIKVEHNYRENNIFSLVLKPDIDERREGKVYSRAGLEIDAIEIPVNKPEVVKEILDKNKESVILIEESQFLSKETIDIIVNHAYDNKISTVMFFGLKVDFKGELFEGSKRALERADKIQESTSICWCGKKARQNTRVVNGKVTKEGPTILIEDEKTVVNYVTLCNYHFYTEELE